MGNRHNIINICILVLSTALLLGSSLAYFSDRKAGLFRGAIGNIEIDLNTSDPGKRVFTYGSMNDISFHARNKGNRAMDLKAVVKIQSNMPVTQGFPCRAVFLPCYRLFAEENPSYAYTFDPGKAEPFTETGSSTALSGTVTASQEQGNVNEMTYEFTGLLNGNHPTKKNETSPGAEEDDSFDVPLHICFPSYHGLPGWENDTKNAYYRVTVKIYGKQHRNTTDADWNLIKTI